MKRENFSRLCIAVSVIGLGIMYVSTEVIQPEKVSPREISQEDLGESIRAEGKVTEFYTTQSASFFTLQGNKSSISVSDFQKNDLSEGQKIVVTGQVDMYRGDLQLVSTQIEQKQRES